MRHLDHAWASTVHAFQGRTVDNVIAAMEARHPHLTTQKSFYVEISRARDRAELVTDDAAELRAQLQAVTGERIAALEGIGEMKRDAPEKAAEAARTPESRPERGPGEGAGKAREGMKTPERRRNRRCATAAREAWTLDCDANRHGEMGRTGASRRAHRRRERESAPCAGGVRGRRSARRGHSAAHLRGLLERPAGVLEGRKIRNFAIVPCHQPAHVRGKNAADIALAIDAVELSYRVRLDGFLLVSSDSDFTGLAQRLRECGFSVFGFGESRTPRAFRSACHRFEIVGKAANGHSATTGPGA